MPYKKFNIVVLGVMLLFSTLLAACGTKAKEDTAAKGTPAAAASTPAASAKAADAAPTTRVFKDLLGHEVTIPTNPKRVIVDQFMGHLLALGVKPVGAASYQFDAAFLKEPAAGVENIGNPVSKEKMLALNPDLIILQDEGAAVKMYDDLSKIAPTIVLSYAGADSQNVLEQLRQIGDIVGKKQEAEQWITKYEAKAKQYREQVAKVIGPEKTFSIVELWAKQTVVYGKNFGRGGYNLYDALQLSPPKAVKTEMFDQNKNWLEVTMESLPKYVGDYIFLTANAGENSAARLKELMDNPVWKSLPAVKNNHVYQMNTSEIFPGDPISVDKQLDIQAKLLLELTAK
ncbi:ABC transporter substrate-binding protein [Paenibacillus alba]|uniref:ABC transporter substrate-binding protein n=1 Tax=Paenibacillus alba TaxID=1197127 RepID=UPI0015657329|nr:ABC transporter substrate-binding protein [Paenibacillus alba]NQX70297.1 ABC transporter substrate-binding protein [Paenibacillus alba]